MALPAELNPEIFESLLSLFSDDREEAGVKYEHLRNGLVRFFQFRGCCDAESLADETINRVANKLNHYDPSRAPKVSSYFYGFASNVLLEYRRRQKRERPIDEIDPVAKEIDYDLDENSDRLDCLSECTANLPSADAILITEYYAVESSEKKAVRTEISKKLRLSTPALHTKVFRIKVALRKCVEKCLLKRKI